MLRLSAIRQWMIVIAGIGTLALAIWTSPARLGAQPKHTPDASCDASALRPDDERRSPDGTYFASDDFVIETATGLCQQRPLDASGTFQGWSADGRFAIFNTNDAEGNGYGILMEPETGRSTIWGDGCVSAEGACRFRVMALAPVMQRALLEDGSLVYLRNAEQYALLADGGWVTAAGFSPGEQFLAYVARHGESAALYVAEGNGDGARPLMPLDATASDDFAITWNQDDTPKFTLRVGAHRWLVNVWTDEIAALD